MLIFATTVFLMIVTPGPGVLTTAGIGSGFGWAAGIRFLIGLFIGTNLTALLVISGLTALVPDEVEFALVWAAAAYFGWLALKIAFAGARVGFMESENAPRLWNGITLQLINPKAYTVNTILFGGYHFMDAGAAEIAVKLVIINVIWVPVHLTWLGAGVKLRRLDLPARTQRLINYAMAASLMAVVLMAALSTG